jgi:Tol biopolymer transport system component
MSEVMAIQRRNGSQHRAGLIQSACAVAGVGLLGALCFAAPAAARSQTGTGISGEVVFVTFSSMQPAASNIQIWTPGSSPTTVFSSGQEIDQPRLSPDGKEIAFGLTSTNGRASSLYLINSDGTGMRRITTGVPFDEAPAWSPDGKKIAFASDRSGNWDIWVKNLTTGVATRLTRDRGSDWEPAWAPAGHRIAFASNRTGHFNIWVANLVTGRQRRLTSGNGDNEYPAWSPDGRRIAFASTRKGTWDIWMKALSGRPVTRFTNGDTVELFPTWSPAGRWIAFEADPHGGLFNIFLKKVSGTRRVRITNNASTGTSSIQPDWGSAPH